MRSVSFFVRPNRVMEKTHRCLHRIIKLNTTHKHMIPTLYTTYIHILVVATWLFLLPVPALAIRYMINSKKHKPPGFDEFTNAQKTATNWLRTRNTNNSKIGNGNSYRDRMVLAMTYLNSILPLGGVDLVNMRRNSKTNSKTERTWLLNGRGSIFLIGRLYRITMRGGFSHYDMYVGNNLMAGVPGIQGITNAFTVINETNCGYYTPVSGVDYKIYSPCERVIRMIASIILCEVRGYSVIGANCQHYAMFAATGRFESPEINKLRSNALYGGIPKILAARYFRRPIEAPPNSQNKAKNFDTDVSNFAGLFK